MKALTLTQPWASLVMLEEKRIETRSWPTAFKGRIAIHAAKGWKAADREFAANVLPIPFAMVTRAAVLGTCELVRCLTITEAWAATLTSKERQFGDYTPGRFAFLLEDVQVFPHPIVARGALGLWNWSPESNPLGTD